MKTLIYVLFICICSNLATVSAQEVTYGALEGKWEYDSPKKKNKVLYNFDREKNFTSTTERKEKELVVKGSYQIDKKNEIDRLRLSILSEDSQAKTIINNYFIKFLGADSLKVQMVTDKQENWRPENRRNTMVFIRQKEKPKDK